LFTGLGYHSVRLLEIVCVWASHQMSNGHIKAWVHTSFEYWIRSLCEITCWVETSLAMVQSGFKCPDEHMNTNFIHHYTWRRLQSLG
jgi:hypothetical protein